MITLSLKQFARLFPAYVILDLQGRIVGIGPSISRLFPDLEQGAYLFDHLVSTNEGGVAELERCLQDAEAITLRSQDGRFIMAGMVLECPQGYMIGLSHAPFAANLADLPLSLADFARSDPAVPNYMQLGMLQGLLDETRENAADLARERERIADLVSRIRSSAGFLAHDFNNLHSIIELNCLNALNAGTLPPDQARRISVILEAVSRSIEATKALTIVSEQKNDSGLPEDIDELIRENWPYFRMIAGAHVNLGQNLQLGPIEVKVSRNGLINCLTSLLMNAREAMSGAGSIDIITEIDHDAQEVRVVVADTGSGMDNSVLAMAFEPFFSTKGRGTGMGLASVIDFARDAGGDALIHSQVGQGTRVEVKLPLGQVVDQDAPEQRLPAGQTANLPAGPASEPAPIRILVVEDEEYALEALAELLECEGYAVTPVLNAKAALQELEKGRFDVLLTDVVMPGSNGQSLATQAGLIDPSLNIILMSGYIPDLLELKPEWLFVRKPLDVKILRNLIRLSSRSVGQTVKGQEPANQQD